jgi:subfamily B ATP-binding cassette protein MsbA
MNDFRRLFTFIRPYVSQLVLSLALLVCHGVFAVCTTALAIPLFDDVLAPQGAAPDAGKLGFLRQYLSLLPGSVLTQLALALVSLTLFKGLSLYYSNILMSYVGQKVVTDLRNKLYAHVLNQSMAFFSTNSTGKLMSRMNNDVDQVQEAVSTSLGELAREIVLLLALSVWVLYLDWRLAVLALIIAPAASVLTLTMGRRIRRASLRSRENVASLSDLLQQTITGVRIVKGFGMERHERARFEACSAQLLGSNLKAARVLFLNSPVMELLGVLSFIPLLYYAHGRISSETLTMGVFGGSLFSLFSMYDPIRKLSRMHMQFQRAFASASRIGEVLDTHDEILDRPDARDLQAVNEAVEFRGVAFDYRDASGETRVLRDINLHVGRKQVLAVIGSSGSGKSTLVSLLPRFYEVTGGAVLIDGVDVRDYTQASLRRNIALVTQETFLFNDTVRNNIAYGRHGAGSGAIVEAARAALAHDFIMQLPMQYETVIGERGQRLSGGERQRISIARAILKNAPILILDEATSALDSESEKLVQQALGNLMQDRTTFVIAHRLSTIRHADIIVVLENGRIREIGTHDSLINNNGPYRRFFTLQNQHSFGAQQ